MGKLFASSFISYFTYVLVVCSCGKDTPPKTHLLQKERFVADASVIIQLYIAPKTETDLCQQIKQNPTVLPGVFSLRASAPGARFHLEKELSFFTKTGSSKQPYVILVRAIHHATNDVVAFACKEAQGQSVQHMFLQPVGVKARAN